MRSTDRVAGWLLVAALGTTFGCGSQEITPASAAGVIHRHLSLAAPLGPGGGGWEGARVEVEEIREENDGVQARFRAFVVEDDRGPAYEIRLGRVEGEWRVLRYGPELRERVALLVAADRRRSYEPLVGSLATVQDTAARVHRQWSRPLKFAPRDVSDPIRLAKMQDDLARGIPAGLLAEGLRERLPALGPGIRWGVTDEIEGDGAEVVWVRRPDGAVCGQLLGRAAPPAWSWLEERFITCSGVGGRYVHQPRPMAILAEIDAGGGAVRAAP